MFVRWFLQIFAMISDLAIWAAIIVVAYNGYKYPLCWLLIIGSITTWLKTGGFIAWTKEGRRLFRQRIKG
jgi:hypothetical protein